MATKINANDSRQWARLWLLIGFVLTSRQASATPAFARQMNLQCSTCHTEFPILNDYGRYFKMGGYTMSTEQTDLPPVAFMVEPGFTHTQGGVQGGAAPGFHNNDNFALGTASIFYTGRLFGPYAHDLFGEATTEVVNKIGVFYQHTYDGVAKQWSWDNAEFRYADAGRLFGQEALSGLYINNNPTLQDPWQTLPGWGYPFNTSPLAATPSAGTLLDGALTHTVIGFGGYTLLNSHWYFDAAVYHTLGTGFQQFMGVDPTGEAQVDGISPYWRMAYTSKDETGATSWEVGTFGMYAQTLPGRDSSAGHDSILDAGLDAQYQTLIGGNDLTATVAWTHESEWWNASQFLGGSSNVEDTLWHATATVHILHDKTYGAAIQYFMIDGTHDTALYPNSTGGSPLSDGVILEVSWLPLNKSGGPKFWPHSNVKLSVQYIIYNHFDGGRSNIDGMGRRAADNNTLFVGAWIAF